MSNIATRSKAFCGLALAAAGISGLAACSAAVDTRNEEPAAGEQVQTTEQGLVVPSTCHWSHEDTIVDPATGKACGEYNACTGRNRAVTATAIRTTTAGSPAPLAAAWWAAASERARRG